MKASAPAPIHLAITLLMTRCVLKTGEVCIRGATLAGRPSNIGPELKSNPTILLRLTRWALALTVAGMPLYVVRWRVGPLPTTLLENLILLTGVLYVLALVRRLGPSLRRTPYDIPIAVLLVAGLVGIVVSPDHIAALGIYRAYFLEPVAIFYVVVALLRAPADFELVLAALAVSGCLIAIGVLGTFATTAMSGHLEIGHAPGVLGINPNSVALYLEPLMALSVGFLIFSETPRQRRLALLALVLLLAGQVATLSRGGLLAVAALAAMAFLSVATLRVRMTVLAITITGALVISQIPYVALRLANQLNPQHSTLFGRLSIWSATLRMLRDHPLFGAGISGYQSTMAMYRTRDLVPEPYAHNIVLTTWSELGLLGLAAFAFVFVGLAWRAWKAFPNARGLYRPLLWGMLAGWVMFAVHGMVDSPYWKNDLSLEFWTLAALEVAAIELIGRSARRGERGDHEFRRSPIAEQ